MANESLPSTYRHIELVRHLLTEMAVDLIRRGDEHDTTKLMSPELEAFDALQRLVDAEGPVERGTPAYSDRTAILGAALDHHYVYNRHHPEHHEAGVSGMNLLDVVEMLCDWRAANVQRDAGGPMSLSYSIEKYQIDPMLAQVLRNTAAQLGWEVI